MALDLTTRISLIDDASSKASKIAESLGDISDRAEQTENALNDVFNNIDSGVESAISSVDGIARSISDMDLSFSNNAGSADYWVAGISDLEKSCREATQTTEELVESGIKAPEALSALSEAMEGCDRASKSLSDTLTDSNNREEEVNETRKNAIETFRQISECDRISIEDKNELANAIEAENEAYRELAEAQNNAKDALDEYTSVINSGTEDINELETAAYNVGIAQENLASANTKVINTSTELSETTAKVSEEYKNAGKSGQNAINEISQALVAAGLTVMVKEITGAVLDLTNAFSEAESTVVKATGASGEALEDLDKSMMNAFSQIDSASLGETASAIGEINTRMGLTGDTLTDVAGKFLDFADATSTNVTGSVANVTKIMNKWGVESSDVESVLDKLVYAGEKSGISVDSLSNTLIRSSATFQTLGLDLDNTIGLLADLELYGMDSGQVMMGLRTAVTNFSKDGLNAKDALVDVIEQIQTLESVEEATALATETFGSRAGQELAGAIRKGVISVESLTGTLDEAQGMLEKTDRVSQTVSEKWQKASNNVSTAFTTAVAPAIEDISSRLAGLMDRVGDFLNEHPIVTKAITAIGTGLGIVTVGITGVTVVATKLIPAIVSIGTAFQKAMGPIGWVSMGITALIASGTALSIMLRNADSETKGMTATTRNQYYELNNLNDEYERTCKTLGTDSEEANRLKYKLDELNSEFAVHKQSVVELSDETESLIDENSKLIDSYNDEILNINKSEVGNNALIQKLQDLATETSRTVQEEELLHNVFEKLNENVPALSVSYSDLKNNTKDSIEAMKEAVEMQAEMAKAEERQRSLIELIEKRDSLQEAVNKAEAEYNAELKAHDMTFDKMQGKYTNSMYAEGSWLSKQLTDVDKYKELLDEANRALDDNEIAINEINNAQSLEDETVRQMIASNEESISVATACSEAYNAEKSEIENLCKAYDEAKDKAYESFSTQFGLFDEAMTKTDATVENAQGALDSQKAYWEQYSANIEILKNTTAEDLNISDEAYQNLMLKVQDGNEQAAGLADSIARALESGDTESVTKLAITMEDIDKKQKEIAEKTADWQTNYSDKMDEFNTDMQKSIEDMDMSDEARNSAKNTIEGYIEELKHGESGAVTAAQNIAKAVSGALSKAKTSFKISTGSSIEANEKGTVSSADTFIAGEKGIELVRSAKTYANGTTDSSDFYIAGENGPELIAGQAGSTVFPNSETDRLIGALKEKQRPLQVFNETTQNLNKNELGTKKISIDINGSGAINVNGNTDKETILEVLVDNIKPTLMNIIKGEMLEEGELSYEY